MTQSSLWAPAPRSLTPRPSPMRALLDGLQEIFERINAVNLVALASCGACGATGSGANPVKERTRLEPGLARLFAVRPLLDGDPEAVRATQRGMRLLAEGRIEECLRELHDAKRLMPRSQVAWCNLGSAYFERGDEDAALHWFREAHRLAPQDEVATLALALLEQRCHQLADAQWLLVNFLQEVDGTNSAALRQLARLHQQQGQWQQAASCFRRLISVDPSNSEWAREMQHCIERAGGVGKGGSDWALPPGGQQRFADNGPVRRDGHNAWPPANGGRLDPLGSPLDLAPERTDGGYDRSGADKPSFSTNGAQGGYDRSGMDRPSFNTNGAQGRAGTTPADLQEASQMRDAGSLEAALAAYRSVLRGDRANAEAIRGVADCLHDLGQHDSAIEAGKQLVTLNPDDPEANLRVAELLISTGRPAYMAEPYLQRASVASSGELRSRWLCATAESALATDDFKKALSSASEAVRLDASDPRALVVLAHARIHVADYEAALRTLSTALSSVEGRRGTKARQIAMIHMLAAKAHERLRNYPQALDEVRQALECDPRLEAARVVKATALQQSGREREAYMELQDVLRRDPQNVSARLLLGYVQLVSGDRKAVATLEGAVAGASAPRSIVGAAKVYLALALDAERRAGIGGGNASRRAEEALKEGLSLHRNLQVVWRELERSLLEQPPTTAVQRLRGICDLDLTSLQARLLLKLLVRSTGRSDLLRALGFADQRSGAATPEMLRSSTPGSRAGSVPPSRYAPEGAEGARGRNRSGSPWHGQREVGSRNNSQCGDASGGPSLGATTIVGNPRRPSSRPLSPGPQRRGLQPAQQYGGPRGMQGAAVGPQQRPPPGALQQLPDWHMQSGMQPGAAPRGRHTPDYPPLQTPLDTPYRGRSQEPHYPARPMGVAA